MFKKLMFAALVASTIATPALAGGVSVGTGLVALAGASVVNTMIRGAQYRPGCPRGYVADRFGHCVLPPRMGYRPYVPAVVYNRPALYAPPAVVQEEGYHEEGTATPQDVNPCGRGGGTLNSESGECERQWSPAELSRVTQIHRDVDPNCGPGKSGTIYSSKEMGSDGIERVIRRRCR